MRICDDLCGGRQNKIFDLGVRDLEKVENHWPKAYIIQAVRTKCIIFGEALRIRGRKYKQNLSENC